MLWGHLVWVWPSRGLSGWSPGVIDVGPPGLCGMRDARGPPSPALSVLGSEGVLGLTDLSCLRPTHFIFFCEFPPSAPLLLRPRWAPSLFEFSHVRSPARSRPQGPGSFSRRFPHFPWVGAGPGARAFGGQSRMDERASAAPSAPTPRGVLGAS